MARNTDNGEFIRIQAAYETLRNPEKRVNHDIEGKFVASASTIHSLVSANPLIWDEISITDMRIGEFQ